MSGAAVAEDRPALRVGELAAPLPGVPRRPTRLLGERVQRAYRGRELAIGRRRQPRLCFGERSRRGRAVGEALQEPQHEQRRRRAVDHGRRRDHARHPPVEQRGGETDELVEILVQSDAGVPRGHDRQTGQGPTAGQERA